MKEYPPQVYELLRLYEGAHPRNAFKPPQFDPDEKWREREKAQRVFRSEVPDALKAAYDIALGDGLVEQHLLEPNEQVSLYRSHGIPVPAEGRLSDGATYPVFPANVDALVFVTDKGRGALAAAPPVIPLRVTKDEISWLSQVEIQTINNEGCLPEPVGKRGRENEYLYHAVVASWPIKWRLPPEDEARRMLDSRPPKESR